jgi:hypothetical protein
MPDYTNPKLRELWNYDPETGKFIWKIHTHGYGGGVRIGDEAGTPKDGYVSLHHLGINYRAHILAWFWQTGELPPKGFEIDHRNTIRNDNRFDNLRLLKRSGNNLNHTGPRTDNTTGFRGVHRGSRGKAWFARITIDKKIIHLGTYQTFEEAVKAREQAETKYWGNQAVNPIYMPRDESEARRIQAIRDTYAKRNA